MTAGQLAELERQRAAKASADEIAKRTVEDAEREAETLRKSAVLSGKEELIKLREAAEQELRSRRNSVEAEERRVGERESALERRAEAVEQRDRDLGRRASEFGRREKAMQPRARAGSRGPSLRSGSASKPRRNAVSCIGKSGCSVRCWS